MKRQKTIIQATECVYCHERHECVSGFTEKDTSPDDGDWSFCFTCGNFSIFDKKVPGALRKPSVLEEMEIMTPRNKAMQAEWKRQYSPVRH
jgi:hypothetical protein